MPVLNGIDNGERLEAELSGLKVGLITNHTGVSKDLVPSAVVLKRTKGVELVRLLSPEHGLYGDVPAGVTIGDMVDPLTKLPVVSLYANSYEPPDHSLLGIDALLFDIQDIGCRYFTYVWTMAKCMAKAAARGIGFYVLDRPNPITGCAVEGNMCLMEHSSLVGLYPIAARHGMTAAEIALYVNQEFGIGADLKVIPMLGWSRKMWFDETGLPWVAPSPNAITLNMAVCYPGTCLIEGTNLSEGRGTTQPFELLGAPFVDPFRLAAALNERNVPGFMHRPVYFTPLASKHAQSRSGGVQVHVADRNKAEPFRLGLEILCVLRKLCPEFEWRSDKAGYPIDRLAGTSELRLLVDDGATADDMLALWAAGLEKFTAIRDKYLIYTEE